MLRHGEEFEVTHARVLFDNNAAFYEWPLGVSRGADGTCTAPKKLVDNIVEVAMAKPQQRQRLLRRFTQNLATVDAFQWAAEKLGIDVMSLRELEVLTFRGTRVLRENDPTRPGSMTGDGVFRYNLLPHVDMLVELVSNLTKLKSLDLSDSNLSGSAINMLGAAVRDSRLEKLNLSGNCYNQEEAVTLVRCLPSTLVSLELEYLIASQENVAALCNALKEKKAITTLELHIAMARGEMHVYPTMGTTTTGCCPKENVGPGLDLSTALAGLIKELPNLQRFSVHGSFGAFEFARQFLLISGGTKAFREAAKQRVSSTPLVLHLPNYAFCHVPCLCCLDFNPYWHWDLWGRCADGCTERFHKMGGGMCLCAACALLWPGALFLRLSCFCPGTCTNYTVVIKPSMKASEAPAPAVMRREEENRLIDEQGEPTVSVDSPSVSPVDVPAVPTAPEREGRTAASLDLESPPETRCGVLEPDTKASPTTANVPNEVEAKLKAPQPEMPNQMIINIPPGAKQVFLTFA